MQLTGDAAGRVQLVRGHGRPSLGPEYERDPPTSWAAELVACRYEEIRFRSRRKRPRLVGRCCQSAAYRFPLLASIISEAEREDLTRAIVHFERATFLDSDTRRTRVYRTPGGGEVSGSQDTEASEVAVTRRRARCSSSALAEAHVSVGRIVLL